jgi:uncharacterized Zn-finger protein
LEKPIKNEAQNQINSSQTKSQHLKTAKTSETGNDFVPCTQCGLSLKRGCVKKHMMEVHLNEKRFICDICGATFRKRSEISFHVAKHIPNELREKFKCDECDRVFMTKHGCEQHKNNKHFGKGRNWHCGCGKVFTTKGYLSQHKKIAHDKETNQKVCDHCGKVLINSSELKVHIRIHHTEGGKGNFMCNECGKRFDLVGALNVHARIHLGILYPCDYPNCDKKYKRPDHLRTHVKYFHLGIKPFECPYESCGKNFPNNQSFKRHIKIIHEKVKASCPVIGCEFMVGRLGYMKDHLKKHLELKPEDLAQYLEDVKKLGLVT